MGEDLYVFEAEDAGEILNWHGEDNSSAGEYITGLIRNRMSGRKYYGCDTQRAFL